MCMAGTLGLDPAGGVSRIVDKNELPTRLMNVPKIPMPTIIVTMAMTLPPLVIGYKSPYPTVVSVAKDHHTASDKR